MYHIVSISQFSWLYLQNTFQYDHLLPPPSSPSPPPWSKPLSSPYVITTASKAVFPASTLVPTFYLQHSSQWSFKKILFIYFLERREGREKKKERNIYVQEIYQLVAPNWGPGTYPRHVPWLGIEPATFWFAGWHSIHWATLASAPVIF